ncbi:Uncharacterised protein [Halioglobus japonicus]|nr:Uncharacterised protein [Halioglobus japonicus]
MMTTDLMNKLLFISASLLGAFAIIWMAFDFAGANALAFAVTASIGGVYLLGIIELLRFRRATASLSTALDSITPQQSSDDGFEDWLKQLDPTIRGGVRSRVVGERIGLPTPAFTPYLVGLLVMLGLLGTFVGMVDTLGGAVSALQGSTELDAIRASLTAPMQGLGVAFGTSVAGVAASAMLGLISTMARHERIQATRQLDTRIANELKPFSLGHQRQQAFDALQSQAGALPAVAADLQAVAAQLALMGDKLGDTLLANQNQFHAETQRRFSELAASVDTSLRESLSASGTAAGASMQPIMTSAVADISKMLQATQEQQAHAAREQLQALGDEFGAAGSSLLEAFATTSSSWTEQTLALQNSIENTLCEAARELSDSASSSAANLLSEFATTSSSWTEQTLALQDTIKNTLTESARDLSDNARSNAASMLEDFVATAASWTEQTLALQDTIKTTLTESARDLSDSARSNAASMLEDFVATSTSWTEQTLALQDDIKQTLNDSARDLSASAHSSATSMLAEIGELLQSTEALVEARTASEATWLESQEARLEQLTAVLTEQLGSLRAQEEQSQANALARFAELESTVAAHLTQLGQGLEEPMTRLIETASETPRAAAEVIGLLRAEITNNVERDNQLLEERLSVMQELNALSASLQEAASGQRSAVENLVESSSSMLQDITGRFGDTLVAEVEKMTEASAHVAGGAIELSSLGEAFSHAVSLFNSSNESMMEHLAKVEESMDRSNTRNDEQMAYYVAQAREIIDHSMLSQKEIMDDMRRLNRKTRQLASESS